MRCRHLQTVTATMRSIGNQRDGSDWKAANTKDGWILQLTSPAWGGCALRRLPIERTRPRRRMGVNPAEFRAGVSCGYATSRSELAHMRAGGATDVKGAATDF